MDCTVYVMTSFENYVDFATYVTIAYNIVLWGQVSEVDRVFSIQ